MTDKPLKPCWKRWRFDQMATNVNERIDDPSKAGVDRYVGLEHIDPESLQIRRWGSPSDVEATKLIFRKGDIIFGRRRAYQRKLAVADFDGICSAHAMVLRAKTDVVLSDFLPFLMQSDLFMHRAQAISVGSLSPTINWTTLAKEEFVLPPLEEQRQLVKILCGIDDAIQTAQVTYLTAEKLARSFSQHAMTSPSHNNQTLSEVCLLIADCKNRTPPYVDSGYPVIRTSNIKNGELITKELLYTSEDGYTQWTERAVPRSGDLVFTREAPVGEACLIPPNMSPCIGQRTMLFRGNPKHIIPKFMLMAVLSPIVQRQLQRLVGGSTVGHVRIDDMRNLKIPVPNLEQQMSISIQHEMITECLRHSLERIANSKHLQRFVLTKTWE